MWLFLLETWWQKIGGTTSFSVGHLTGWNFSIDFIIIRFLKQIANIFRSIDSRMIGRKFSTDFFGFPSF